MSAAPQPYERQANFTSFEQQNPTSPKPGSSLDAEFNAVRTLANALLNRLNEIQRDDGRVRNGAIQPDTLSSETLLLIGSDVTPRGNWLTGTVYAARDLVNQAGLSYIALSGHLSGVFATDLAAGKWQVLSASVTAASIPYSPAGGLVSIDVQAALTELAAISGAKQPISTPLTQIAAIGLPPSTFPFVTAGGAYSSAACTTIGRILMGAMNPETVRSAADIVTGDDPFNFVQLDSLARLPAVDASLLFNVGLSAGQVGDVQLAATLNLTAKTVTLRAQDKASDYIEIRDEKVSGTDGGGFTQGAWQTRTLNTEHADSGSHASIASNQITLAAGTYICDIEAPAGVVGSHQARLRNITDGATTLVGTTELTGTGNTNYTKSRITGRFTIASTKVFEVQHQCQTTKATDGFGNSASFGETEIYTVARFWKVG